MPELTPALEHVDKRGSRGVARYCCRVSDTPQV